MKKNILIISVLCLAMGCNSLNGPFVSKKFYYNQQEALIDSLNNRSEAQLTAMQSLMEARLDSSELTNKSLTDSLEAFTLQLDDKEAQLLTYQDSLVKINTALSLAQMDSVNKDSLSTALQTWIDRHNQVNRQRKKAEGEVKSLRVLRKKLEDRNSQLETSVASLKNRIRELESKDLAKFKIEGNSVTNLKTAEGRPLVAYKVGLDNSELHFFWRNAENKLYDNFDSYRRELQSKGQTLVFATNGGMYKNDQSPQGLYIEKGKLLAPVDMKVEGYGNFYLQPNGIFLITKKGEPMVIETAKWPEIEADQVEYATQSGPMLLVNGKINSLLNKDSPNFHIRSGVGVDRDGDLVFIISNERVRFYELARAFVEMGCENALYLDGAISQTFLPEANRNQSGGGYGVMIGVSKKN